MAAPVGAFATDLTPDQEKLVAALRVEVAPFVKTAADMTFCTQATYVRYLRARHWHVHKAARMLEGTLVWRAEFKPYNLRWKDVQHDVDKGKLYILNGTDKAGRPVILMRPRLETIQDNEARLRFLVYTLERAAQLGDSAPDGKMTWLLDLEGYSRKNSPPIRMALQTLHILQNHFPERLGLAVCYQTPFVFEWMWRAVKAFVDSNTKKKLVFLHQRDPPEVLRTYFDPANLDDSMGGDIPIGNVWDVQAYGKHMSALDFDVDTALMAAELELTRLRGKAEGAEEDA